MINKSWNFSKQSKEYSQKTKTVVTVDVHTLYFRVCIPEAVSLLRSDWLQNQEETRTNSQWGASFTVWRGSGAWLLDLPYFAQNSKKCTLNI